MERIVYVPIGGRYVDGHGINVLDSVKIGYGLFAL